MPVDKFILDSKLDSENSICTSLQVFKFNIRTNWSDQASTLCRFLNWTSDQIDLIEPVNFLQVEKTRSKMFFYDSKCKLWLYFTEAARGEKRQSHKCYGCGKAFSYSYDLQIHISKHPDCKAQVSYRSIDSIDWITQFFIIIIIIYHVFLFAFI